MLLADAVGRWPLDLDLRLQHAFCAHNAGLYAEARARWDRLRSDWPECAMAWSGSAANARELGRIWEAKAVIDEALRRFPTDLIALSEAMRIYDGLGQPVQSLELSGAMVRLDPNHAGWWREHFDRLMAAAQIDAAAALAEQAPDRANGDLAFCGARIALRAQDLEEAERLLRAYVPPGAYDKTRFDDVRRVALHLKLHHPAESLFLYAHLLQVGPDEASLRHHHADALIRCGRCSEAEAAARAGLEEFPGDYDLLFDLAHAALKMERWEDAIAGFERLVRSRPDCTRAMPFLAQARMERAQVELENGAADEAFAAERQDVGVVENDDVRRLLLGFESLGQDCEFGLVQRHYGAEPLGLFRWNFTRPDLLRQALDTGLDGIGDPAHTLISLWPSNEYKISDERWGFAFHTWISQYEIDRDELYRKMCRRIAFLRSKLLADIAAGEKVFVLKTFDSGPDVVRAIFASLRTLGPVRLLWVRSLEMDPVLAGEQRRGNVVQIEPDLYAGYVSAFGNRLGSAWQIMFDEWADLCRNTVAIRVSGTAQREPGTGASPALGADHVLEREQSR